jgi:hypothetical protein
LIEGAELHQSIWIKIITFLIAQTAPSTMSNARFVDILPNGPLPPLVTQNDPPKKKRHYKIGKKPSGRPRKPLPEGWRRIDLPGRSIHWYYHEATGRTLRSRPRDRQQKTAQLSKQMQQQVRPVHVVDTTMPWPHETEVTKETEQSEQEDGDFMDMFDPQMLVKDNDDAEYLESLSELKRETVLYERFQRKKDIYDMRQDLRSAKKKTTGQHKLDFC